MTQATRVVEAARLRQAGIETELARLDEDLADERKVVATADTALEPIDTKALLALENARRKLRSLGQKREELERLLALSSRELREARLVEARERQRELAAQVRKDELDLAALARRLETEVRERLAKHYELLSTEMSVRVALEEACGTRGGMPTPIASHFRDAGNLEQFAAAGRAYEQGQAFIGSQAEYYSRIPAPPGATMPGSRVIPIGLDPRAAAAIERGEPVSLAER